MSDEDLHAPYLVDSEVASWLRRRTLAGQLDAGRARSLLQIWAAVGLERYSVLPLLDRIWELRDNLSTYDAGYVALAEALDCPLVTADARISRAPGVRCLVTVVPR